MCTIINKFDENLWAKKINEKLSKQNILMTKNNLNKVYIAIFWYRML